MSLANSSTFCIRVAESRLCFVRRLKRPLRKPLRVVFTFYSPLRNKMAHPESVGNGEHALVLAPAGLGCRRSSANQVVKVVRLLSLKCLPSSKSHQKSLSISAGSKTDRFRDPVVGDSDKSLGLGARLKCCVR